MLDKEVEVKFTMKIRAMVIEGFAVMTLCYCAGWCNIQDKLNPSNGVDFEEALTAASVLFILIVFAFEISGAQFNPAVSLALALIKKQSWTTAFMFVIAQLIGSVLGAILIHISVYAEIKDNAYIRSTYPVPNYEFTYWSIFWFEYIAAFGLCYGFIFVLKNQGGRYMLASTEFAIVITNMYTISGISGACFNPARVFGPSLVENGVNFQGWYLYWVGPILGGMAGMLTYECVFDEKNVFDFIWAPKWVHKVLNWMNIPTGKSA